MNDIAEAYIEACRLELDALKPGNVHRHAGGHGMTWRDFETSALVSAPSVAKRGARVGERIRDAVMATQAAVGQNTNLGILLLCAPLAAAAESGLSITAVLDALDLDDATHAFAAIATANPGGLGSSARHDVRAAAATTLLQAMIAAADRDLVARQYAHGFSDVLGFGLDCWRSERNLGRSPAEAATSVYLAFLRSFPDTHIARKFGVETAEALRLEANRQEIPQNDAERQNMLSQWDVSLKARGLNPGACADLTVATLFAALLQVRAKRLAAIGQQ